MKKIALVLAAVLGFAFLISSAHAVERSSVRREITQSTKVSQAIVVQLNNKAGRASCVIYPDAQGDYPSIEDIASPDDSQANGTKDQCGGCPEGQFCRFDNDSKTWSCKEGGIKLPPNTGDPL